MPFVNSWCHLWPPVEISDQLLPDVTIKFGNTSLKCKYQFIPGQKQCNWQWGQCPRGWQGWPSRWRTGKEEQCHDYESCPIRYKELNDQNNLTQLMNSTKTYVISMARTMACGITRVWPWAKRPYLHWTRTGRFLPTLAAPGRGLMSQSVGRPESLTGKLSAFWNAILSLSMWSN